MYTVQEIGQSAIQVKYTRTWIVENLHDNLGNQNGNFSVQEQWSTF